MNKLDYIAVYCGSNFGTTPAYHQATQTLGEMMAKRGYTLVYGGGKVGLMGTIADAVIAHGGRTIGVIPKFLLEKEVAHLGLDELITTPDMSTRKTKMIELADAFIALPGGIGTYEELFEVISLAQLRQHAKPIGVLNVAGFFDPLIQMLTQTAEVGFMPKQNVGLVCVDDDVERLFEKMQHYQFIETQKWVKPDWLDELNVPKFI
ncbi:TIGR00730 family Rossman fold protein [Moraxella sp.]|uniref:LOG family protein n=1 Tax=Moraxella sp. TaxID=479 RepID=UPI0026DCA468|nr:TIGR00730 family Rossman fold protein [Moraxella sp.]MDO4894191.1 TIGR00730 family Rossman fold protein [Moraxella sp.]